MSSLSTLPKGDSAWLLRKAIERIMEQVSVLETNIGSSTTGNSANTEIIFNDAGTLRGDAGLVYNKTTDALTVAGLVTAGSATITGALDAARLNVTAATIPANGVYLVTTNKIGFSTNSTQRLTIDATGNLENTTTATQNGFLQFSNTIDGGTLGYFGNPRAFITGGATSSVGIRGESSVQFSIGANLGMTLDSTGLGIGGSAAYKLDVVGPVMRLINSAATADIFITDSGTTNGNVRLRGESNALKFITGGGVSATIDASGNLAIGVAATGTRRLELKSVGTSNTTFAAHLRDSADTLLFHVRSDGYFNTGQGALSPYSNTTGSAANMFVDSSGFVYRSTSSLKYKTDVKDSIHGLADVLKLRSVTYKSKNGDDTVFGGLIAEEVHAAGLTEFVAYAPDKTPDSINYGNMVALLVSAIKELTARVQTLEAR